MNIKLLLFPILGLIFFSSYSENLPKIQTLTTQVSILDKPIMCSDAVGRCVGSAYCTVCKNCSRCGYCRGGGSCGVCGKRQSTYRTKKRKTTPKVYQNNSEDSAYKLAIPTLSASNKIYKITTKTSLRSAPNSQAEILQRLSVGEKVEVIDENSEKYWSKVIFEDQIGWVKKHLLEFYLVKEQP